MQDLLMINQNDTVQVFMFWMRNNVLVSFWNFKEVVMTDDQAMRDQFCFLNYF